MLFLYQLYIWYAKGLLPYFFCYNGRMHRCKNRKLWVYKTDVCGIIAANLAKVPLNVEGQRLVKRWDNFAVK